MEREGVVVGENDAVLEGCVELVGVGVDTLEATGNSVAEIELDDDRDVESDDDKEAAIEVVLLLDGQLGARILYS